MSRFSRRFARARNFILSMFKIFGNLLHYFRKKFNQQKLKPIEETSQLDAIEREPDFNIVEPVGTLGSDKSASDDRKDFDKAFANASKFLFFYAAIIRQNNEKLNQLVAITYPAGVDSAKREFIIPQVFLPPMSQKSIAKDSSIDKTTLSSELDDATLDIEELLPENFAEQIRKSKCENLLEEATNRIERLISRGQYAQAANEIKAVVEQLQYDIEICDNKDKFKRIVDRCHHIVRDKTKEEEDKRLKIEISKRYFKSIDNKK